MQADIKIKVLPRASKSQILGMEEGVLKVKVTSPPVEGRANKDLIELLSKELRIPKKHIEILSGKGSRFKRVRFRALSREDIRSRLNRQSSL
ncbi:MAG: YggU family protein [Deltaproteobacteria bacterium]|nr:YggU family protein [Deltaproteobacteria bacterium]MBW2066429.1 YggU family protein [Deltaproteobacteria bacterium]